MKTAVIGAGAWGTVFGGVLRDRGHEVEILGRERPNGAVEDAISSSSRAQPFVRRVVRNLPGQSRA